MEDLTCSIGLVEIKCVGRLTITADDGVDLTPRGTKARAVLAVLALTSDMSRSRRWLEDLLWHDRAREQANASLRQSLSEIRRCFGKYSTVLKSNRDTVSFDPSRIVILQENDQDAGRDLFEGLDPHSAPFLNWLKTERLQHAGCWALPKAIGLGQGPKASTGLVLRYLDQLDLPPEQAFLRDVIVNEVGQAISERLNAWVQSDTHCATGPAADIEIECNITENNGAGMAFLKLTHRGSGRVLFTRGFRFDTPASAAFNTSEIGKISTEASERLVARLANVFSSERADVQAGLIAEKALGQMFSFNRKGISEAKALLETAIDIDPSASFYGWRSLASIFNTVERLSDDTAREREETEAFSRLALERDPDNTLVLATTAIADMLNSRNTDKAGALVETAIAQNRSSALVWLAASVAHSVAGDNEKAYRASFTAREIASTSRYRHWWDTFHSINCIAVGQLDEALKFGQDAALLAPDFCAPHRHLLALYAQKGDRQKARRSAAILSNLEPDFSLVRLREDPDYPVRTLRGTDLIKFPLQIF